MSAGEEHSKEPPVAMGMLNRGMVGNWYQVLNSLGIRIGVVIRRVEDFRCSFWREMMIETMRLLVRA